MIEIVEVDDDCNIFYGDGSVKTCPYRPHMTFQDCEPGYGGHGGCPKWNYYHKKYRCGDNCKGECSGEVDGIIWCPEELREGKDGEGKW